MPVFGRASKKRYATVHWKLQKILDEAIQVIDFTIVCGYRTEKAQEKAFRMGRSQVRWPDSKHNQNPSIAVDIAPWDPSIGNIDWNNRDRFILLAGIIMGIAQKFGIAIRWGGDFNCDTFMRDQRFVDMPHIELMTPDKDLEIME